jgi:hypothetical protein
MSKAVRNAFIAWIITSLLVIAETIYIYSRHGTDGFNAFMQEAPYTNIPITLASVAMMWLLAGLLLWLILAGKITRTTALAWSGFFIVAASYLNILRERVRYGDIDYYIQAAFALVDHEPLPDTYLYPPLWATLLSFLTPFGEDGILLICWIANLLSLFLFYYLLLRILEHYGFKPRAAALVAILFMLVNMPIMRTLMYVQVNFHMINLIFLSILLFRERPFLSALALALAVHLKASPVVLVLAFLLEFNWKWVGWFLLNMSLIAVLTIVVHGITPYFDFINNFIVLNQPRSLSLHDSSFDAVIGMTLSYFRVDFSTARVFVYIAKGAVALVALVLCLRSRLFYPQTGSGERLSNAIVPLLVAMTASAPLIWEHHGVFMTLPFLLLLKKLGTPAEWIWYGVAYLFEFLMPTFEYFPWSSYSGLFGILTILGLLWLVQKRDDNAFFINLNTWAESSATFGIRTESA